MGKESLNKKMREGYRWARYRTIQKVKSRQMKLETYTFEEYQVVPVQTNCKNEKGYCLRPCSLDKLNPLDQMIEVEINQMKSKTVPKPFNKVRRIKKESETT
jgi:hypothetical protein